MIAYTPCSSFTRFARIESVRSAVVAAASPVTVQLVRQEQTCAVDWSSASRGSSAQALTPPRSAGASVERHIANNRRVRVAASGGRLAARGAADGQLHGL